MTIVAKKCLLEVDSSVPVPKCPWDISTLVQNCPDTSAPVYGAEMSCVRSVLGPKCLDTYGLG